MPKLPKEIDDVVIAGIGGFFPKSRQLEEFTKNLMSNESLLESRWKEGERGVSNKLGLIPDIEYFDPAFFGIHRQQATFMDPMQRLMLERTCEALCDAGLSPSEIRGKRVGVYMGSSIGENDNLFYESIVSGFGVTGHSRAMMANRISYWLNLKGPSCSYDSNWINGIEVLQMGYDAVRYGHCEAAIVGTVNLALNSEISWLYNDMGLLSADGSTKAFDVEATGYARADGVVALIIQRASVARRSYATIMGTSTIFNGHRDGTLLDVDQECMTQFIRNFYENYCKVKPEDVSFIECYGSGLKKTDEAELNAIDAVYCQGRKSPLMVGAVKTNAGHSEACANLVSLAKVLIAFETGVIPATIQYKNPNPNIKGLLEGRLKVVTENTKWDGDYAAIHGIGLSTSYAHCVLKRNVKRKQPIIDDIPRLVLGSTRTEADIKLVFDEIKERPYDPEYISLVQEFFCKTIPGHLYKGYSIINQNSELVRETEYFPGNKRQTWFIYSGMGSQWNTMGKQLMQLPIFAESIQKSHNVMLPFGLDLIDIITTEDVTIFDKILHSFVGIAAIQIALTDILNALGIVPDGIIGHSVGELGCSYADECLTAEQIMMCAYSRGKASADAELIRGMMAAVGMGYNQIKNQLPETIEVACHNSATSCTLSGPKEDMEKYVKELTDKGIFARLVNVANIAYHSRYIKPAAPFLLKYLEKIIPNPKPRSSKWISTSVPEYQWDTEEAKYCSAQYHTNNLLGQVLFEEGSKHIPKDAVCIEIAPHGLLQAIVKKSLKSGCTNIPLTLRGHKNGVQFLLSAIGKMYLAGIDMNVTKIFPTVEYPVSRGTAGSASLIRWEHGETWRTGLEDKLNYLVSVKDLPISIASDEFKHCVGHQLDGRYILPVSSYLTIMLNIFGASRSLEINEAIFENIRFRNIITIPKVTSVPFYGMVQRGSGEFEILSGEEIICTGKITLPQPNDNIMVKTYEIDVSGKDVVELNVEEVYNEFLHRGCKYTGSFRNLQHVKLVDNGSISTVPGNQTWQVYLEAMLQQHYFKDGEKYQNINVPMIIERINISIPNLPKSDDKVEMAFDYSTKVVNMPGLQLCRVTTTNLPLLPKPISFDAIDFLPLDGVYCDNLEMVINYSLNLTINNYKDAANSILIYEVVQNQKSKFDLIKSVTDKYRQLSANISSVQDPKIMIVYQNEPILIFVDGDLHPETANAIISSDAFALVKVNPRMPKLGNLVTLACFHVNNEVYSLITKVQDRKIKEINVKLDSLSSNDILKGSQQWVVNLKNALSLAKSNESVYLCCKVIPIEGCITFINEIRSHEEFSKLKFYFDLDGDSGNLQEILKPNLLLLIKKNGKLGTSAQCSIDFKNNASSDMQLTSLYFKATVQSGSLGDGKLEYIGINSNNETLHAKDIGLGNIDYCVVDGRHKTIGLAYFDKNTSNLVPDEILKWKVPDSWSPADACTIPHAYATAYYAMIIRGKLEPGETVLIHGGCSAIGLAAISIAINMGCTVFATVATDHQKAYLNKQFASLRDRNILSSEYTTFELHLLGATSGNGAHVILNTVTDSMFHATVRCLAAYGRLIQLGKVDRTRNNTMGMSVFLKNTCLMGVVPERMFDARDEIKTQLRDLVQRGIDKYVVRPLNRKVVQHQDFAGILNTLSASGNIGKIVIQLTQDLVLSQLNIEKSNQYICDSRCSQLVYNGEPSLWIDVVEWLVLRGGRKIFVMSGFNQQTVNTSVQRRLNLLKTNFGAVITIISDKIQTKGNAAELIAKLYQAGPIQGVYVLPNREGPNDINSMQYLESALRTAAPKALFVNFLDKIGGIAEQRIEKNVPTHNLLWNSELSVIEIISVLDDILSYKVGSIYVKNDQASDIDHDTIQTLYKKLSMMLPISGEELVDDYTDLPQEPQLIQLPSSGPRKIRELPPLIIVPGLTKSENIREFAMELLCPVFCAPMPQKLMSINDIAKSYAEKVYNLYKRGPYNIIGVSWGGPLAIEIARILQSYANTQVTLLDAAPDTVQSVLKCTGEGNTGEIELLNRILKINDALFLKNLNNLASWDHRVDAALQTTQGSEEYKTDLKLSLNGLKRLFDGIISYKYPQDKLIGKSFLIRPTNSSKFDDCGLKNIFQDAPNIFVATGDHLSILHAETTIDYINENVTVK